MSGGILINPGEVLHVDPVAVGDLDSDAKGSGARRNSGKPEVDLIPVRFWLEAFQRSVKLNREELELPSDRLLGRLMTCVQALAEFQEGAARSDEMMASVPIEWYLDASRVLEYGKHKYAAWNWLKGMPWSVPVGCALRHAYAIIVGGELTDEESGQTHIGHFVCNLIMLRAFDQWYPEGNDFPAEKYFAPTESD